MSADVSRWYQECERCQCAKGVPSVPGSFEPKFPFDFLLGRVQEPSAGSVHRFWSRRISCELRFEGACERLDAAANRRKARHDLPVREAALKDGQLVYLHDYSMRGRCKIQDLWSSVVYQVMRVPKECGPE
ncbi:Transposon Ty3-I Gag-Pol poly [Labeo rohita]|uniref:Transposon Ty3-I Gag-Pol poly n=1 Tax=Labeo rohita TaxID=84645 RepID=A0A498LCZ0_LABRO|nr:Transposon Ty3-I Gag-Pol poly [Labeo rohita]